ncbi:NAD(P)H-dependent oxidoreductase [Anaerobacillus sp. MEB173]|uniref:NAD(P)H-dependent oxidoreductase n=1 Tax=Anaerobacillus sp. MEB173 TaxID=3383345 RepID=UPI003F924849
MNHLIIYMHPTDQSFNGAILQRYVQTLKGQGHHVEIRNLYKMNFQPLLSKKEYDGFFEGKYSDDIQREHDYIRWSDVITFIYPLWWTGFPAIGKGYIDRVFSFGFAYRLKDESPIPLLNNKKAVTICTMGTPSSAAAETGILTSMNHSMDEGIFHFCGITVIEHLYFGNAVLATNEEHEQMLEAVQQVAKKVSW